jgi:uncharacterized membrane protein YbaN (DUF454 family)
MSRIVTITYGLTTYVILLAAFVYAGFILNFGMPEFLDSSVTYPGTAALLIDGGLLSRRNSARGFTTVSKLIYGCLGWCAVGAAFAGIFIPGLPVTVFLLIAAWFFARSFPRFENYLKSNRWLGPYLQRFHTSGGMPWSAKIAALACMWTGIVISAVLLAHVSIAGSLITIVLGGVGTLTILLAIRTVTETK